MFDDDFNGFTVLSLAQTIFKDGRNQEYYGEFRDLVDGDRWEEAQELLFLLRDASEESSSEESPLRFA